MVTLEQAQYKLHFDYKVLRFSIEYRNFMNSWILTEITTLSNFVNPLGTWVLKIKFWKLFYRDNFLCSIWWRSQNFQDRFTENKKYRFRGPFFDKIDFSACSAGVCAWFKTKLSIYSYTTRWGLQGQHA
jgi:hypothetical protein